MAKNRTDACVVNLKKNVYKKNAFFSSEKNPLFIAILTYLILFIVFFIIRNYFSTWPIFELFSVFMFFCDAWHVKVTMTLNDIIVLFVSPHVAHPACPRIKGKITRLLLSWKSSWYSSISHAKGKSTQQGKLPGRRQTGRPSLWQPGRCRL